MASSKKTFLILDGNALLHRAWHAIPPLSTQDGRVVNAVYGFTNVVEKMLLEYKPDYMAVAWDLPGGTFRHEEYEPYKATREKKADELYAQIPIIQNILLAYGIPSLSATGFEADDILGTIASMNERKGDIETLIVTGDLDSLQLVSDKTKVVVFIKGLSQVKVYDQEAVQERYGLPPERLIDLKALVGDTSDNLPGVSGIGDKGAVELLQAHGDVDGIIAALQDGSLLPKFQKKLQGQEEVMKQMKRLVTIVRDVSLPDFSYEKCTIESPNAERLLPIFEDLEFKNLVKKYKGNRLTQIEEVQTDRTDQERIERMRDGSFGAVQTGRRPVSPVPAKGGASPTANYLSDLSPQRLAIAVIRKAQDLFGALIESIAVTDGKKTFVVEHPDAKVLQEVVHTLSQSDEVIAFDVKALLHLFADAGVEMATMLRMKKLFDVAIASYMLNAGTREHTIGDVTAQFLGKRTEDDDAAAIARCLFPLADQMTTKLRADGMEKLYSEVEVPLISVLYTMERTGIFVDREKLQELSEKFGATLDTLAKQIHEFAKKEFNINSPSQLAVILFEDLQLPTKGIKKTKSGYSTAAPELEKLWDAHPMIPLLHEYRESAKLKSTYADALPHLIAPDGRIHSSFNQTVAATGRLSSSDPNLQNIPIRSKLGREIRDAFIAPDGYVLLSADYSQIELRLAASLAKDASFIQAFQDGVDIHRRTAAEVWEVAEDKVTKDQRAAAKAINFSILYGVGAHSLARSTNMRFDEAKQFIAKYFAVHPGIAAYIDAMKLQARSMGFVETIFGRRRYLPDIHSEIPQLIAAAERMAMNMPIQGSQADIIKMAMIKIDDWIRKSSIDVKMLLQVHDELVFEVVEKDQEEAKRNIRELMTNIVALEIPLIVDVATAKRWGEMK